MIRGEFSRCTVGTYAGWLTVLAFIERFIVEGRSRIVDETTSSCLIPTYLEIWHSAATPAATELRSLGRLVSASL